MPMPKTYANALGRKKLDAALAADNDLRDKINKALDKWRAKQQESGGSIAIDDGNRPTRPTANTVRYIIQDQERSAQDYNETTHNNRVETNTIADDSLKPKGNLYTAFKNNNATLYRDLKTFPRLRSKATYLIDIRTTLQDVETLISARIILLKVHAVHEESLISKNQRDGTLTLSHMEDQLTTI
ncbi:hypothetical protein PtrV1_02092 [Pyrenophora tritici-repentis]|nr:hypothetical protein PtrV1_02092 [Pyrenophora tritici-repentis]